MAAPHEQAGATRIIQEPLGARRAHLAALAGAAALMVPAIPAGPLDRRWLPEHARWQVLGLALELGGLGCATWARAALGRYWTGRVAFSEGQPLIRTGPYRFVRHPLYAGILAGAAGTALVLGRVRGLLALLLLVAAYRRKIDYEEAALRDYFGAQYED